MRYEISQGVDGLQLGAVEPSPAHVGASAATFAAWYSEPYNRRMMDGQPMVPADVLECYQQSRSDGGRIFHLYCDGALVGDADFRHVRGPTAEFAIMIGSRKVQGRGLGTRFSRLLHHLAFQELGLETVYLTVLPQNVPGQRCYEKLGYQLDQSDAARAFQEEATDIPMSLTRQAFYERNGGLLEGIRIVTTAED